MKLALICEKCGNVTSSTTDDDTTLVFELCSSKPTITSGFIYGVQHFITGH
jgi:hypothetical protein